MSDFVELKKRIDEFLKEIKSFASEVKTESSEGDKNRYIELRSKKNELTKEVKDFVPEKKIMLLDSKKSGLIKSMRDELVKAEKALAKQKIEVPKDDGADEEDGDLIADKATLRSKETNSKKSKTEKEDGNQTSKAGKEGKKGKNKVQLIDDDRKSTTSSKSKAGESPEIAENDFQDTDEEAERNQQERTSVKNVDEDEIDEEPEAVEEDKISASTKGKENSKAKKLFRGGSGKSSKDKTKEKLEAEPARAGKEEKTSGKKSRKDSAKSVASEKGSKKSKGTDQKSNEENPESSKDAKKTGESRKDEKVKKENGKDGKESRPGKGSENGGKDSTENNTDDQEELDENSASKDKTVKDKEDSKSKSKDKDKEDTKSKSKDKDKEDTKSKSKEDTKSESKDKDKEDTKSKSKDIEKDDAKTKDKSESKEKVEKEEKEAEEVKEVVLVHSEPKQLAAAAAANPSHAEAVSECEDDSNEEGFQSETESEEETEEPIVLAQASRIQESAAPATSSQLPTPAPRAQKTEGTPPTASLASSSRAPVSAAAAAQPSEDEEEEDEDDEESEYDYENMRTLELNEPNKYEVLRSYSDDDPDIINIRAGEVIVVVKIGPDGWWLARNSSGGEGLVPSNLLRLVMEEESESSDLEEVTQADTTILTGGVDDLSRTGPTDGNNSEDEEEDDLSSGDLDEEVELTSSALSLSQRMVAETNPTPPGVPAGFRVSNLARWFYEGTKMYPGRQFTLQGLLQPKLSASCMSLQDGWGCSQQVHPVASRVEKLVHLQKCQMMPIGLSVKVIDRFIRLCFFDGYGPVSNVHTVRATVAKDERVWSFGSRASDTGPGVEYGEAYLKYNNASNQVRLLLEATVVCQTETSGSKPMELSIGHAFIPLFDDNGSPTAAKAYDLQLEGGTPFEQQKEVDPSIGQSGTQKSGASARTQPRIQLKVSVPNKETKEFMDICPGTVIGNLANLQLHSLHRQILGAELLYSNCILSQRSAPIYAPHLVQFPAMADQPDLMDTMRKRWNDFAKRDRTFKKPVASEIMKQEFIRIVKSTYFLNQLKDFQPFVFGNKVQEQLRATMIQDFLRKVATDQSAVNFSLSADLVFEPFTLDEVALPMIGQFSLPIFPVAVE